MIKLTEIGNRSSTTFALSISTPYEYYDSDEKKHNNLHIAFLKKSYWFKIPFIIKPLKKWVDLSKYDWSRESKGYWDYIQRQYGFTYTEGAIHVYYGIQPGSWSSNDPKNSDHTKLFYIPWMQQRWISTDYMNKDHSRAMRTYPTASGRMQFDMEDSAKNLVKRQQYRFQDFDGTECVASIYYSISTYRVGDGLFSWLGYILPKKIYHRLDIDYDQETGIRKGSWKGGTHGISFSFDPDVGPVNAWYHHAFEEGFKNIVAL